VKLTGRQRAMAFLAAAVRSGTAYSPPGEDCATCGTYPEDDAARRSVFAVGLDLGILLAQGFAEDPRAQTPDAYDLAVGAVGVPFCRRCAASIVPLALAEAGKPAPDGCPCKALPMIEVPGAIAPYAFAVGFVLGEDVARCQVCLALGTLSPTRPKESLSS